MTPTRNTVASYVSASVMDTAPDAEDPDAACHTKRGYISDTSRYLTRLKRIEGQVRGIHRMVEEQRYCIDILTQVSALNRALESVALGLLDEHLRHCVMDAAAQGGPVAEAKLQEASNAIARLVRS